MDPLKRGILGHCALKTEAEPTFETLCYNESYKTDKTQRKMTSVSDLLSIKYVQPSIGPIQPRIQWLPGPCLGLERSKRQVVCSHSSNAKMKNERNLYSPICVRTVDRDNFSFLVGERNVKRKAKMCGI